jgi:di/tricarboxylate transporter
MFLALSLFIMGIMFAALVFEWQEPAVIIFTAMLAFLIFGIISPAEALAGFSNEGLITIAALFAAVSAIQKNSLAALLEQFLSRRQLTYRKTIWKIMLPIGLLSSFVNNTPLVLLFTPIIKQWAVKAGKAPSKFLIPLSYAAILGGLCTLVGTSTNLIVNGYLIQKGQPGFSLFEFSLVGLPCLFIGLGYLAIWGDKLLPARMENIEDYLHPDKKMMVSFKISPAAKIINATVSEAKLRNLTGMYLIAIIRNGEKIFPVSGGETLKADDLLIFTGKEPGPAEILALADKGAAEHERVKLGELKNGRLEVVEAVVARNSSFSGKTLKQENFRGRYVAVVIGVYRSGMMLDEKIGEIKLKPGDILMVLAGSHFRRIGEGSADFFLLPSSDERLGRIRPWVPPAVLITMFLLVLCNITTMLTASLAAVVLLLLLRCMTIEKAIQAIDWKLIIMIGAAFGIAEGIENSGLPGLMAGFIAQFSHLGPFVILIGIYMLTNIVTEMITNSAAAITVLPIVFSIADSMSLNPEPYAMAVAIAASAAFATPVGYQTHLIVYSSGGYTFKDFLRAGIPLNLIIMFAAVLLIPLFWDLTMKP